MRVYKFYPAKWGREALGFRRLKVSPVDELNDPFEYLSLNVGRRDVRKWAKELRRISADNNGIISFSRTWKQPLLWAHYADSHRGLALGFDVPKYLLMEIDYVRKRIIAPRDIDQHPEKRKKLIEKMFRTKHIEWRYEEEERLLRPLEDCVVKQGMYFAPFNHATELREVIIGEKYESVNWDEGQLQMQIQLGIEFITARAEFTGFKMTKQTNECLWKKL